MSRDLTAAETARMHALSDLAADAQARCNARQDAVERDAASLDAEGAAYLRAYAETCRSVAQRLRASPGAAP